MIERKGDEKDVPTIVKKSVKIVETKKAAEITNEPDVSNDDGGLLSEDVIMANRRKLAEKLAGGTAGKKKTDLK